jgi:hypothetical protein
MLLFVEEFRIVHRREIKTNTPLPKGWSTNLDTAIWYGTNPPTNEDWNEAAATSALMNVEEDTFMGRIAREGSSVILQKRKALAKLGNISLVPFTKWKDYSSDHQD